MRLRGGAAPSTGGKVGIPIEIRDLPEGGQYLECQHPSCLWSHVLEDGERLALVSLEHKTWHVMQEAICRKAGEHTFNGQACSICLTPNPAFAPVAAVAVPA